MTPSKNLLANPLKTKDELAPYNRPDQKKTKQTGSASPLTCFDAPAAPSAGDKPVGGIGDLPPAATDIDVDVTGDVSATSADVSPLTSLPFDSHLKDDGEIKGEMEKASDPAGHITVMKKGTALIARATIGGREVGFDFRSYDQWSQKEIHHDCEWWKYVEEGIGHDLLATKRKADLDRQFATIEHWYNRTISNAVKLSNGFVPTDAAKQERAEDRFTAMLMWNEESKQYSHVVFMRDGMHWTWSLNASANGNLVGKSDKATEQNRVG